MNAHWSVGQEIGFIKTLDGEQVAGYLQGLERRYWGLTLQRVQSCPACGTIPLGRTIKVRVPLDPKDRQALIDAATKHPGMNPGLKGHCHG